MYVLVSLLYVVVGMLTQRMMRMRIEAKLEVRSEYDDYVCICWSQAGSVGGIFFPLSKLVGWDRMGIGRKGRRWRYKFFFETVRTAHGLWL